MAAIVFIEEPRRPVHAPGGWALWSLGFRPFYLAAALAAVGRVFPVVYKSFV